MHRVRHGDARLLVGLAGIALGTAACGASGALTTPPTAGTSELDGVEIAIGTKEYDEQFLLGQIAFQALANAGAEVAEPTSYQGTEAIRVALISGEIDVYWEYTGTGWVVHLGHEATDVPAEPDELAAQVRTEDFENGVVWLEPARANNGYAIAAPAELADELGVDTLSAYAELVETEPEDGSLCAAPEFIARADGWSGVEERYGFDLPDAEIVEVQPDLVYDRLADAGSCSFGEVFGTDGRIMTEDLVIVEDGLGVFVPYNIALTVNSETYERYGEALEQIFDPITARLTEQTMIELNARVQIEGEDPADVAAAFLQEHALLD